MFGRKMIAVKPEDLTDDGKIQVISRIVIEKLELQQNWIDSKTPFVDLGADSLDQTEIVMCVEDYYLVEMEEPAGGYLNVETLKEGLDKALSEE